MRFYISALMLFLSVITTPAIASEKKQDIDKIKSATSLYVATAGEVFVTFISKSASYSSDLFLEGSSNRILNNQSAVRGQTFSLGSFQAGTELVFKLFVRNTGATFFTGDAEDNIDNFQHAIFKNGGRGSIKVRFEDAFRGGDKDYNDLVFSVSNVTVTSPIPEPQTYGLMLIGLMVLGAGLRKKA